MVIINFGDFGWVNYAANMVRIGNVDDDVLVISWFQFSLVFKVPIAHRGGDAFIQGAGEVDQRWPMCFV